MGFEPTTPCGAPDFESGRWPVRLPSGHSEFTLDGPIRQLPWAGRNPCHTLEARRHNRSRRYARQAPNNGQTAASLSRPNRSAAGKHGNVGIDDTARATDRPDKPIQTARSDPMRLPSVSACTLAAHVRVLAV